MNRLDYCTRECASSHRVTVKLDAIRAELKRLADGDMVMTINVCQQCGHWYYTSKTDQQRFCTRGCAAYVPKTTQCQYCQKPLDIRAKDNRHHCCDDVCWKKLKKQHKHAASVKRRHWIGDGHVDWYAVMERDNWTCKLCGLPCQRDAQVPDYMAPTLDHIVPLSRGGKHDESNAQCAHFICNSRKRDSVPVTIAA